MDGELLQTIAVAGVLLGAVAYLGRRALATLRVRKRDGGDGCGGGCGCSSGR